MARSDNRIAKLCRFCGNEFSIPQCRDWREHYCSPHCRAALKAQLKAELARICPVCSATYYSRRSMEIGSCSPRCAGILARGRKQSPETVAKRLAAWERNGNRERQAARRGPLHSQFLGRKMSGGYVWVWAEGRGYMQEHRMVAEASLGRELADDEVVHHINEIRDDNRPENLMVMSRADHMREHSADIVEARKAVKLRNGRKLNVAAAARIREAVSSGRTHTDVAAEFGITPTMVGYIANGKSWSHAAPQTEAERLP